MTLTVLFKRLGAPLANSRWSWGSVRTDGTVVMRVWMDECKILNGIPHVRVITPVPEGHQNISLGYDERLGHLELIQQGARCLLVMCEAVDPKAVPRAIKSFNEEELFEAGEFVAIDEDGWLEIGTRVRVSSIKFEAAP